MDGAVLAWDLSRVRDHSKPIILSSGTDLNREFSPDGKSATVVNLDGEVTQWRGDDFQIQETLFSLGKKLKYGLFSKDVRLLAVGSTNAALELWDVNQRRLIRKFGNYSGRTEPVLFSSDNRKLVVRDKEHHRFHEWDLSTFQEIRNFPSGEEDSGPLRWALSADYRWFLSATYMGDFTLTDARTLQQSNRHLDIYNVISAAFSADAKRFAACSGLGNAGIWENETFQPVAFLGERENPIYSVNFSADGSRLITGSTEAVMIWDVATLLPRIKFETSGLQHTSIGFTPDGNAFSSHGGWNTEDKSGLYLWRAPSWEEIASAEAGEKAESKQP